MMFWKRRIYADAAAATPLSPRARAELVRLLPLFGNPGGLHREALDAKRELEQARARIAKALGAHADEIVFTGSGTEANNLALGGLLRPLMRKKAVHAITSSIEHSSVLAPLRALVREGLELTELPVSAEGSVDLKVLAQAVQENTVLVSIQLVNSEMGAIQPLREIGKLLKKQAGKIFLHTDAAQAPLWMALSAEKLGVDLMSLDGQKVQGPKGAGCLYIRRGVELEPVLWGGGQEQGLRAGTENVPLVASFAAAFAQAQEGVEERSKKVADMRDALWSEIQNAVPEAVLNGPSIGLGTTRETRVANNLNISIPGISGELAVIGLDAQGIAASTRSACDTQDEEPSHVIEALGHSPQRAKEALRLTLLPDAGREVFAVAPALKKIVQRQRNVVK